jgi:hypothetical protein
MSLRKSNWWFFKEEHDPASQWLFRARIIKSSDSITCGSRLASIYLLRHTVSLAAKILLFNSFISPDINRRAACGHGI